MFPSSVLSTQLWPAVFFLLLVLVDSQSDYGEDSSYHDLFKHYPHLRHFVGHPKYTGVYHQSRSHSNSPHIPMDHKYYDGGDESYEDYHSRGHDYKSKEPYGYRHKSREDDQYNNDQYSNDQYSNDHYTDNVLPDHYAKHYENWAENEPHRRDRSHYQKKYSPRQPIDYPSYTPPKHSEYSGHSGYSEHSPPSKHTRPSSYDDTYKMKHSYRSPYHSYNVPIEHHHHNSPAKHNQDTDEISEYTGGGFGGLPDFGKFEYNPPSGFSYDTEIHHITDPIGKSSNKLASVLSLK